MQINKITKPTMLIDKNRCLQNIDFMVQKSVKHGLDLRPHFKTHQSADIGRWFSDKGVKKITVSSVSMAQYFVAHGWKDITIAFPFNPREVNVVAEMSLRATINVIVASSASVPPLLDLRSPMGVFIKLDVGTKRTGINPGAMREIEQIVMQISMHEQLTFKGFLFHTGHTYRSRGATEIIAAHGEALKSIQPLIETYRTKFPDLTISGGDTPACSVANDWMGVDEIRPGNFVFYDLTQWQIGACSLSQIAVALACPVVAKHSDRQSIILYGGGIHLSKERLEWEGKQIYGLPVVLTEQGWQEPDLESFISSLSQEHGVVKASQALFDSIRVGDLIGILPVHSCMSCNLMKSYTSISDGSRLTMMSSSS